VWFILSGSNDTLVTVELTLTVDKSTGLPILFKRSSATFSMIVRIAGNSSTTSLKSSACNANTSHTVCAVTQAVRLVFVKRQISASSKKIKKELVLSSYIFACTNAAFLYIVDFQLVQAN
jgi:hypothetical protein